MCVGGLIHSYFDGIHVYDKFPSASKFQTREYLVDTQILFKLSHSYHYTMTFRWLMDRAERFRSTHLTVITSGLSEGLKHSESRDFLATLPRQQKKSKSFESLSRILQSEIVITAEVHGQEEKRSKLRGLSGLGPPRSKRQSSARSSHSLSFRNHPAYAPSIGSRHDSNASLVSSTVETAAYLARTSFRRREAPGGGFKVHVCVCVCVCVYISSTF